MKTLHEQFSDLRQAKKITTNLYGIEYPESATYYCEDDNEINPFKPVEFFDVIYTEDDVLEWHDTQCGNFKMEIEWNELIEALFPYSRHEKKHGELFYDGERDIDIISSFTEQDLIKFLKENIYQPLNIETK